MSEANFSFTTKINGDLFTIRGENYGDFTENLAALINGGLSGLVNDLLTVQAAGHAAPLVNTSAPVAAAPTPVAAPVPQEAAATPPAAAPAGTHLCDHGQPMKLIPAGISKKTGAPYKAFYVCAQPQGLQCKATVRT